MQNVIKVLLQRGFIEQMTHEDALIQAVDREPITCYIGFDPTASSLHVGSLIPIMALAHMQRSGHRPIALVGGGTGLVGDPSGKTEMRQLLTQDLVEENAKGIASQLSRFIEFSNGRALMLNNADWLVDLKYIPFLRDVGRHFSVNRMIKAESYRIRLESEEGLNFIEFNYMVLQAYDFLELFDRHNCCLQMGGSDQWGNIVAGIELIRRMRSKSAYGITFPLITTSSGAKMGKTAAGAVWLDPARTSPYDYFQFWVNTDDRDVERFLALFTFLPMVEIQAVRNLEGVDLNAAKTVLAFEATRLAHGDSEARKALEAAWALFGARPLSDTILASSAIHRHKNGFMDAAVPQIEMERGLFTTGIAAFKLFHQAGLADSSGASRRLIAQGGAYVNGCRLSRFDETIDEKHIVDAQVVLRAGKKRFCKILIKK
jgi:tyrosyl-tRNA synthetase